LNVILAVILGGSGAYSGRLARRRDAAPEISGLKTATSSLTVLILVVATIFWGLVPLVGNLWRHSPCFALTQT
jgi:hypothetical protein